MSGIRSCVCDEEERGEGTLDPWFHAIVDTRNEDAAILTVGQRKHTGGGRPERGGGKSQQVLHLGG
jgi:hypothetical protein